MAGEYGNNDALSWASAAGNFITNAANVYMQADMSRKDRKFSKEMSEWAYQKNLEAWNLQNEYNLPENQYRRQLEGIRANGLNPNLVYGSGSGATGTAGSVSPFKFEGYHSTAVPQFRGNPLNEFLSTRLLQTQVAAQEANNRYINARAANEESRHPGIDARSREAAYRWNKIEQNLLGNYDEAIQASIAKEYWTGVKAEYEAATAHYKRDIAYYEAAMAQWLNDTEAPGTGMTYRQYMEACKAFLPGAQFARFKADILNIASQIAYRKSQGELLDLKKEFQRYVNRLARYGRSLGNDWVTLLISGLHEIWPTISPDLPVTESPKSPGERGAMAPDGDSDYPGGGSSW